MGRKYERASGEETNMHLLTWGAEFDFVRETVCVYSTHYLPRLEASVLSRSSVE